MQVLVVDPPEAGLPEGTADLLSYDGWTIRKADNYEEALDVARDRTIDAVILREPCSASTGPIQFRAFDDLLRIIKAQRIAAVMVTDHANPEAKEADANSLVERVGRDVPLAELRGRFAMIDRYQQHFKRVETELYNMERLGKRLNEHFREVDQEMRLAARLQRDFLPQIKEPIGNVQFARVYRPASWVSGDIFDVFRIDEEHTGFYVADAVGHGMAASLLTMFIKRAVVPKAVQGDVYTLLSPSAVLANLNSVLTEQALPNCQFVTACYFVFNHRTLSLQYARGGHPYPVLITRNGMLSELKSSGGLLGIFQGGEFPTFETRLNPGDKVMVFTDGVELAFQDDKMKGLDTLAYQRTFESLAYLPVGEMLRHIEDRLDDETGSLSPRDDVTIVGLEVLADGRAGSATT